MSCSVLKVRQSAPEKRSATSNFSTAALCHVYFSRGELQRSVREGERSKGVSTEQIKQIKSKKRSRDDDDDLKRSSEF